MKTAIRKCIHDARNAISPLVMAADAAFTGLPGTETCVLDLSRDDMRACLTSTRAALGVLAKTLETPTNPGLPVVEQVEGLTDLQAWMLGVVQAVGWGEEREAEVVAAVFHMAEDLGGNVQLCDARAVLRHLLSVVTNYGQQEVEDCMKELDDFLGDDE